MEPEVSEILEELDADERSVLEAQRLPAAERGRWLQERSGRGWTDASIAHVEERTFVRLRRALQQRGLLQS